MAFCGRKLYIVLFFVLFFVILHTTKLWRGVFFFCDEDEGTARLRCASEVAFCWQTLQARSQEVTQKLLMILLISPLVHMQCRGHARSGQHRRQQTLNPSVEAPCGGRRVPARVITRTVVLRHVNRLKKTPEKGHAPKRRKILEVTMPCAR